MRLPKREKQCYPRLESPARNNTPQGVGTDPALASTLLSSGNMTTPDLSDMLSMLLNFSSAILKACSEIPLQKEPPYTASVFPADRHARRCGSGSVLTGVLHLVASKCRPRVILWIIMGYYSTKCPVWVEGLHGDMDQAHPSRGCHLVVAFRDADTVRSCDVAQVRHDEP